MIISYSIANSFVLAACVFKERDKVGFQSLAEPDLVS